jgi:hypothetical protein
MGVSVLRNIFSFSRASASTHSGLRRADRIKVISFPAELMAARQVRGSDTANAFALSCEVHWELHRFGSWNPGIELHELKGLAGSVQIHRLFHVPVGATACAKRVINFH